MNKQKLLVVFVLLPVVCSLFFSVGSVSAYDLELDSYAHYKVIAYEAGVGAGTDYQVVVVCHYGTGTDGTMALNGETVALLHVGDIQADFDDVRFANQFGEVLTFKRCSYTSAVNATFVVKVEANLDVDQLVYVYYGNGGAVDASSDNALVDVIGGVVGAWNMEESLATNPVVDYSGNGNHGTANGTTIVSSPFFTGKTARSFSAGDFLNLTRANVLKTPHISLVVLVKPSSVTGEQAIFDDHYDARIFLESSGTNIFVKGEFAGSYITYGSSSDNSYTNNVNHYIAFTFDGNTGVIYIDGTNKYSRNDVVGDIGVNPAYFIYVGKRYDALTFSGIVGGVYQFSDSISSVNLANWQNNYGDSSLVAGSVLVRKWATTTLPEVAGVSDAVDNTAFSPVVDGALTDTEWFISGLLLVLALANVVLLAFPFALLRFVFGVLSFALSAWAFTYGGLPLAPYLQIMGLVVSVVCMFLATRARE